MSRRLQSGRLLGDAHSIVGRLGLERSEGAESHEGSKSRLAGRAEEGIRTAAKWHMNRYEYNVGRSNWIWRRKCYFRERCEDPRGYVCSMYVVCMLRTGIIIAVVVR